MSFSSWLRMWQCHTYSQAKLVMTFVTGGTMRLLRDRVDVGEPEARADGDGRVQRTEAVRDGERQGRRPGAHRHDRVLEGRDADGVLPAELLRGGEPDLAVPADAVDDLHVEDVEVDGVHVHAVVADLPDLRAVAERPARPARGPRSWISVAGSGYMNGVMLALLVFGMGICDAEVRRHAGVLLVEGGAHLVVHRLRLHGEGHDGAAPRSRTSGCCPRCARCPTPATPTGRSGCWCRRRRSRPGRR